MPTVLRTGPYRIYFHSHEPNEPPHVHVDRDAATAKVWLQPVNLASTTGFNPHELTKVLRLVERHQQDFLNAWHRHFE